MSETARVKIDVDTSEARESLAELAGLIEFPEPTPLLTVRRRRRLSPAQAREVLVAMVYLVAFVCIAAGVALIYVPAGVIVAGLSLAAWAFLVFAETAEAPTGDA